MNDFKVGDIVVWNGMCGDKTFEIGKKGKVMEYYTTHDVDFLRVDVAGYQDSYFAWRWDLVSPETTISTTVETEQPTETKATQTGGSTPNQYRLSINLPLTEDRTQYVDVDLEAMDVIDALDLSGNLKDVQKALFRMGKKDGTPETYDFNKCIFFLLREMKKRGIISHGKFWEATKAIDEVLSKCE